MSQYREEKDYHNLTWWIFKPFSFLKQ